MASILTNVLKPDAPVYADEHDHDHADVSAFGFWLYIVSDLVLFSALFATYAVLSESFAGGPTGAEMIDLDLIFVSTMLLLFSSLSFGLSLLAMHAGQAKTVLTGLVITFLLGGGFIALEAYEFHHLIVHGAGPTVSAYWSAFFGLVGTHGAHVSAGLVWIAVMVVQVLRKGLNPAVRSRLVRLGMFWHFLDVVWIFVFSIVYLLGAL
ncbi:MAG: cytochrome o ubiquinol oxidase subunit III [Alphaproteobacteria bacterium]|nr:cytochrome o ubiquinol oxidase subunit III [Alphaproteobacteria bacterium]